MSRWTGKKSGCILPNPGPIVSVESTFAEGTVHNFAGIGETCYSGDEGLCGEAGLYLPLDVACDSHNDLYICDSGSNRIRKIDRETGIITTVVGTGEHGFNGDGPALEVNLTWPAAIAFDRRRCDVYCRHASAPDSPVRFTDRPWWTTIAGSWTAEDEAREQPLVARNLVVLVRRCHRHRFQRRSRLAHAGLFGWAQFVHVPG